MLNATVLRSDAIMIIKEKMTSICLLELFYASTVKHLGSPQELACS